MASTACCRALSRDQPTTSLKATESLDTQPSPIPLYNCGFKVQNSAPDTHKVYQAGASTRYKASPLAWHTRSTMVIPKIQLWTQISDFFFFVPLSGCDSSLGSVSSQRTAPDELLLIYSMCGQAYWGIRAPCSRSRIRVSPHMESIKSKLCVEASPHQAAAPNEGTQPTAAQPQHLPHPGARVMLSGCEQSDRLGVPAPQKQPAPPYCSPRLDTNMGPPKPFKGQLFFPASTALRQETVMGAKRTLKINVEQKNFHKIKIAVSFPLITYYKPH